MDDKYLMENLLFGGKVLNDLYLHGVIESSNESVSVAFLKALQEAAQTHNALYKEMESHGFYTVNNVDTKKIEQTINKLDCSGFDEED